MKVLALALLTCLSTLQTEATQCTDACLGLCQLQENVCNSAEIPVFKQSCMKQVETCKAVCTTTCGCVDTCMTESAKVRDECNVEAADNVLKQVGCYFKGLFAENTCRGQCFGEKAKEALQPLLAQLMQALGGLFGQGGAPPAAAP
ncbi:uncharacterized protein LOC131937673 [Physella acuta]|uniref:uncharacterized protein LOC131937673 n=1 Tax=Physella acuta TaxID=109671 RepID=UPI0027DADACC|nr:uncharacterized protein LOC131937673 [Physella acuta]